MTPYRFSNGKAVEEQPREDAGKVVIDLSKDDEDDHLINRKRSSLATSSTSPQAQASSSSRPTPTRSDSPNCKRGKTESGKGNRIPPEAKTRVAMAILQDGVNGFDRARIAEEVGCLLPRHA